MLQSLGTARARFSSAMIDCEGKRTRQRVHEQLARLSPNTRLPEGGNPLATISAFFGSAAGVFKPFLATYSYVLRFFPALIPRPLKSRVRF